MMSRAVSVVTLVDDSRVEVFGVQMIETELGPAINYCQFVGLLNPGDTVLVNRTAQDLNLGTGGYDFIIARLAPGYSTTEPADAVHGHLMRLRYSPLQYADVAIEDDPEFQKVSSRQLNGFPVVVGELHSQIAPVISAFCCVDRLCAYVMTDSGSLAFGFSELVNRLMVRDLLQSCYTLGQSFGGEYINYAVTLHDALIAIKHTTDLLGAIVCQGPGNTGTGTKYGFSGIEQASNLDVVAALGGTPIACIRASDGDKRQRHQGISHHTMTVLELVRSRCVVAIPEGIETPPEWMEKHDVWMVAQSKTQPALDLLKDRGINVTTMGRTMAQDPLFFHSAAAAGIIAAEIAAGEDRAAR